MENFQITIDQIGTFLLLAVFWSVGLYNLLNWNTAKRYLDSKGYNFNTSLILLIAVIWQFGAAVLTVLPSTAEYGCALLILFTLLSSLMFYQFWRMEGLERYVNFIFFLSNMGVIGGLLLLLDRIHMFKSSLNLKFMELLY